MMHLQDEKTETMCNAMELEQQRKDNLYQRKRSDPNDFTNSERFKTAQAQDKSLSL